MSVEGFCLIEPISQNPLSDWKRVSFFHVGLLLRLLWFLFQRIIQRLTGAEFGDGYFGEFGCARRDSGD